MNRFGAYIIPMLLCLYFPSSALGDYIITIEYFETDDPAVINTIKNMERTNDEKRKILQDDMGYADENSRRTLVSLMDVFKWYQVVQYREAFPRSSLVFSQDLIVKENEATYHAVEVPGGYLIVSLDVRSKKKGMIPVDIKIVYNNVDLYSGPPKACQLDQLTLLHESYREVDDDNELEMLFMNVTICPPDQCIEEQEEQSENEKTDQ